MDMSKLQGEIEKVALTTVVNEEEKQTVPSIQLFTEEDSTVVSEDESYMSARDFLAVPHCQKKFSEKNPLATVVNQGEAVLKTDGQGQTGVVPKLDLSEITSSDNQSGMESSQTLKQFFGSFKDRVSMRLKLNEEPRRNRPTALETIAKNLYQPSPAPKQVPKRRPNRKRGRTSNIIFSFLVVVVILVLCKYVQVRLK